MAFKLLESLAADGNDVAQQIDDGALINFQAAQQRNGLLWGCVLSNTTASIMIGQGVLMVRGYRLKIDSVTEIFSANASGYPSINNTMYLFLRITRTGNDAKANFICTDSSVSNNNTEIEKHEGAFDYKIASFTLGPSGVKDLVSYIAIITAIASAGGSSTSGLALPEPRIELITSALSQTGEYEGMTGAYLCLANKNDYAKFTGQYTIKFVIYRHIQKGRYRNKRGDNSVYTIKTGFVKCKNVIGWHDEEDEYETRFNLSTDYRNLKSADITQSGTYKYSRTDFISPIWDYIEAMFYEELPDGTKQEITADSTPNRIRATRSKKNGRYATDFRHNYFKFAFKAELYDSTNKKVAESGLSRMVTIRPNRKLKDISIPIGSRGNLFIINID